MLRPEIEALRQETIEDHCEFGGCDHGAGCGKCSENEEVSPARYKVHKPSCKDGRPLNVVGSDFDPDFTLTPCMGSKETRDNTKTVKLGPAVPGVALACIDNILAGTTNGRN